MRYAHLTRSSVVPAVALVALLVGACGTTDAATDVDVVTSVETGESTSDTENVAGGDIDAAERIEANFDEAGMPLSAWMTCDDTSVGAILVTDIVDRLEMDFDEYGSVRGVEASEKTGAFCTVSTSNLDLIVNVLAAETQFVGFDRRIEIANQVRERNDLDAVEFVRSTVGDRRALAWLNPGPDAESSWRYRVLADMGGFGLEVTLRSDEGSGPTEAQQQSAADLLAEWAGNYQ